MTVGMKRMCDSGIFSEDLYMSIMAYLPITSLMRFRTVSKMWNDIIMDPHFRKIRTSFSQELVDAVMCSPMFRYCPTKCSASGLLLMVRHRCDVHVMQPSKLSLKLLPHLDFAPNVRKEDLKLKVINMVVDERTKEYTVFVVTHFYPLFERQNSQANGRGRVRVGTQNLHRYNSATNAWSLWESEGLNLDNFWSGLGLVGVVKHRDHYTALVLSETQMGGSRLELLYRNESCRWEALPGRGPSGLLYRSYRSLSFFDHKGKLYLAIPSLNGCSLLEYGDETGERVLLHDFGKEIEVNVEDPGCLDSISYPYAHVLGDFLHFGAFVPEFLHNPRPLCLRMTYNLVTGELLTDLGFHLEINLGFLEMRLLK